MEELFVIVLQFFLELFLEVVVSIPFEFLFGRKDAREQRDAVEIVACLFLGLFLGGISLTLFPHTLIGYDALRIANMIAAPIGAGYTSYCIASWRYQDRGRQGERDARYHFWYTFMVCLGIVAVRFVFAEH